VRFHGRWVVRRLAPDCSRIELASLVKDRDEARLLYSMGWETGNMHFSTPQTTAKKLQHALHHGGAMLHKASKAMLAATRKDWKKWQSDGSVQRRVRRSVEDLSSFLSIQTSVPLPKTVLWVSSFRIRLRVTSRSTGMGSLLVTVFLAVPLFAWLGGTLLLDDSQLKLARFSSAQARELPNLRKILFSL